MKLRRLGVWAAVAAVPLWLAAQQLVSFTYALKNRDVRSVLARVTDELGPRGQVLLEGAGNRITVKDEADRLARIRKLLADLDVPARHFALGARLDVLPRNEPKTLFKAAPGFVDMTQWAETITPVASYEGMMDVFEGQRASCMLGKEYRLSAKAQGYDPTKRRLALETLALARVREGQPDSAILQGAAVLPEGAPTLFLINATNDAPALRLKATPTLLPAVTNREIR